MKLFSLFRGLRRQRLKPSGCRSAKPTKGARRQRAASILFAVMGLVLVAIPIRAQDESTVLYPGTYQAEDAQVMLADDAKVVNAEGAEGEKAIETNSITFSTSATEVKLRWKTEGQLIIQVNDEIILFDPTVKFPDPFWGFGYSDVLKRKLHSMVASLYLQFSALVETDVQQKHGWFEAVIERSTLAENYTFQITSLNRGGKEKGDFQLDSITIIDRSYENSFPYIAAVGITLGMTLFVVVSALRERWRR